MIHGAASQIGLVFTALLLALVQQENPGTDHVIIKSYGPLISDPEVISLVADGGEVETGELKLFVSNQSFAIDPVDIRVWVDDQLVFDRQFPVLNQHAISVFLLRMKQGRHRLRAETTRGSAVVSKRFRVRQQGYAVLDFWYYPPEHFSPTPRSLSLEFLKEPPMFL